MFGVVVVDEPLSQKPVWGYLLNLLCGLSVGNSAVDPFGRLRRAKGGKAKGINRNRKSPKFDWSSLLSTVNLVDEV